MKGRGFARAGALVGLALLASCTLPEERTKPKTPAVVCPARPPVKGMVLATIHEFHLANSGFPFSRLGDVLDAYRPDMILIDTPPETIKGEHPEDASVELEYIKYVASTRSTDLVSIAPDRDDTPVSPQAEKGDEDALAREAGFLSDPQANNLTFDQANGPAGTEKIAAALNARERYLKGDPDFVRREAWLEHGVDKILNDKQPKRVLLIVDPINRAPLEAHLYERGLDIMNPVKVVSASKEKRDESAVPSAVLATWNDRLNALQDRLHRLRAGADRSWLEYRVNVYQIAVDKHGSCCVALDMLQPPTAEANDTRPIDRTPGKPNKKKTKKKHH
jgi:hypothetical protein